MKNISGTLNKLQEKWWGEDMDASKSFLSFSILISTLIGVAAGGGSLVVEMFGNKTEISLNSLLASVIFICAFNVFESIICTGKPLVATLRSVLVIVLIALGFVVGFLVSTIIVYAIIMYLLIQVFLHFFFGSTSSSKDGSITLDNGAVIKKSIFGGYRDQWGNSYTRHRNLIGPDDFIRD